MGHWKQLSGSYEFPLQAQLNAPTGVVGEAYSTKVLVTGGVQPYSFALSSGALPGGLSLDAATGDITGTPTTVGTPAFTVDVTDSDGTVVSCSGPINIIAASVGGAASVPLTSLTSPVEVSRYPEEDTRLLHGIFAVTANFSSAAHEDWTLWLSKDDGVHWLGINWYAVDGTSATISIDQVIPDGGGNWKFAAKEGRHPFNSFALVVTSDLPAGVAISARLVVADLGLPTNTLGGTGVTVAAGNGGTFPYNKIKPDGVQYYSVPSFVIDLTDKFSDSDAWVINVTFQDFDAAGNAIGPEHIYGDAVIVNGKVNIGRLDGDYGSNGWSYDRFTPYPDNNDHWFPGGTAVLANICKFRMKIYASNRKDMNTTAWTNTLASVQLVDIGGGLGYLDIVVAVGGAVPAGKIPTTRFDKSTIADSVTVSNGKMGINTTNIANVVYDSSFESNSLTYWSTYFSDPGGYAYTVSGGHDGGYAAIIVLPNPVSQIAQIYETAYHGCAEGDPIHGEAWVSNPGSGTGYAVVYAMFYDASGTYFSNEQLSSHVTAATAAAAWTKASGNCVTPAGAFSFRILVEIRDSANTFWRVDDVLADVVPASAVQAASMAAASVTYANQAIGGNAVVDSNVASVNIGKLVSGTVVFSGDIVLSRGSGKPVIVMDNSAIYLYGAGSASGSGVTPGVAGSPSYTASGLAASGYVSITASDISLVGATVSTRTPAMILNSSGVTIWRNNGDTTQPYLEVTASTFAFHIGAVQLTLSITGAVAVITGPDGAGIQLGGTQFGFVGVTNITTLIVGSVIAGNYRFGSLPSSPSVSLRGYVPISCWNGSSWVTYYVQAYN